MLGRAATCPGLGRVALYSRCLVGPSGAVSPATRAGRSRYAPLWAVCTVPLLLASLGRIDPQASQLQGPTTPTVTSCLQALMLRSRLVSVGLWCSLSVPLECVARGGGGVVIWLCLKLSPGCAGCGVSWEVQSQPPPVPCLGPPGTSYRWLLLVFGVKVPKRDQGWYQGRLPLVPGLGPPSKR